MQVVPPGPLQVRGSMQVQSRAFVAGACTILLLLVYLLMRRMMQPMSAGEAGQRQSRHDKTARGPALSQKRPEAYVITRDASDTTTQDTLQSPAPHSPAFNLTKSRPKRGELPCFTWQKTGSCPKGAKCWYGHDPAVRPSSSSMIIADKAPGSRDVGTPPSRTS
jgi:hypothetical protein